ncbi:hypothetical protein V8E53_001628 [Lactarius tabidus]
MGGMVKGREANGRNAPTGSCKYCAKAWGEAWSCDLTSDAGIDLDSDDSARKIRSLSQPQQPDSRTSFPHRELRHIAQTRSIFRTPTDAFTTPAAGLIGALGSPSFSLPTVERAQAEMERSCMGATLCFGRLAGTPTSPILRNALSPTHHDVLNPDNLAATSAASPGASTAGGGSASRSGIRRRTILMQAVGRKMGGMCVCEWHESGP